MSEIYIPNMEMPKSCFKGAFNHCPSYADCKALKRFCDNHSYTEIINTIYTGRLEDCPLVEVPIHGRLIDVDKMFSMFERACCTDSLADTIARDILEGLIKNAPTIIEASTVSTEERE